MKNPILGESQPWVASSNALLAAQALAARGTAPRGLPFTLADPNMIE
jgi:hypothetical protein